MVSLGYLGFPEMVVQLCDVLVASVLRRAGWSVLTT